jgi:hypothetical protein
MTEKHMRHLLDTTPGIGVEVKTSEGFIQYYFYEDFDGPATGIQRAMQQLYPRLNKGLLTAVKFIENTARKAVQ